MVFIYLALGCFTLGILAWIAGGIVHKRQNRRKAAGRSQNRRPAEILSTIARIIFLLAALFFVIGFMLVQGAQTV